MIVYRFFLGDGDVVVDVRTVGFALERGAQLFRCSLWRHLLLLIFFRLVSGVDAARRRSLIIALNETSAAHFRVQAHVDWLCFLIELLFAEVLGFLRSLSSCRGAVSRNASLSGSGAAPPRE